MKEVVRLAGVIDRIASHHNAATPAACGHAMLVPSMSLSPPPVRADFTAKPGAEIVGFVFEKDAAIRPIGVLRSAPTEMMSSAAAGSEQDTRYGTAPL